MIRWALNRILGGFMEFQKAFELTAKELNLKTEDLFILCCENVQELDKKRSIGDCPLRQFSENIGGINGLLGAQIYIGQLAINEIMGNLGDL